MYNYSGTSSQIAGVLIAIYLTFFGVYLFTLLAAYIVNSIAFMSFFRKVGVKPWIAWVPVYSVWVRLEIGGLKGWYSLFALIPGGSIATVVLGGISDYHTGIAFRKDNGFVALALLLPFVWAFLLGGKNAVYEPGLLAASGRPAPLAGFGSVLPNFANANYQAPPTAPTF